MEWRFCAIYLLFVTILSIPNYSIGQSNMDCLNLLNPISNYENFEKEINHEDFLVLMRNCLHDNDSRIEYIKSINSEYYLFDKLSCSFNKTNCVPNEVLNMVTKIYACRKPCRAVDFLNRLCKVIDIGPEKIYCVVYYNKKEESK